MDEHAFESLRWVTTLALGTIAIGIELRTRLIPNWLTLGANVPVVAFAYVAGHGMDAIGGWFLAGIVGVWLFREQVLAGGGVKNAALLGAASGMAGGAALAALGVVFGAGWLLRERFAPPIGPGVQFRSSPFALTAALGGLALQAVLTQPA